MLKIVDYLSTSLTKPIGPSDTKLEITGQAVKKLNTLEVGDYTYITLSAPNGRAETVKYTHTGEIKGTEITVERDVGRTGALNYPAGTCVGTQFNSVMMEELLAQKLAEVRR